MGYQNCGIVEYYNGILKELHNNPFFFLSAYLGLCFWCQSCTPCIYGSSEAVCGRGLGKQRFLRSDALCLANRNGLKAQTNKPHSDSVECGMQHTMPCNLRNFFGSGDRSVLCVEMCAICAVCVIGGC